MTRSQEQAYRALSIAADRIGRSNYAAGAYRVTRDRRGAVASGYRISESHQRVIQAMSDVASGKMSPNDAIAMLHEYDVERERLAG